MKRKSQTLSTIHLEIQHYTATDGREHIDTVETVGSGGKVTCEERILSNRPSLGEAEIGTSRVMVPALKDAFLKASWEKETIEEGVIRTLTRGSDHDSNWFLEEVCSISLGILRQAYMTAI